MGKRAKEHRKKVAKRNEEVKASQIRVKKAQQEFFKQLIERERAAGAFENNPQMPIPGVNGPSIDLGVGPMI